MPWDVDDSSGLLAHFIGTVDESVWTTDSTKQDPNAPFLQWHVTVDDILQQNFQGQAPESVVVNISIGKGWVEDEDGLTVEHKDGMEMFKASSVYGKIVGLVAGKAKDYGSNAKVMDGDGNLSCDLSGVARHMQQNGYDDPRRADIWKGLTFEFRGIGFTYRNTEGDPFQQVLPVRLVDGQSAGSATAAAPKAAAKTATREPVDTVGVWEGAGADNDLANTLNDLVNASANHTAFAKNAVLLDGVKDNDDLRNAVMDSANFPS